MKEVYEKIGEMLSLEHGVESGQMFGKACMKVQKKAFVAFFKDEMVFKLGQEKIALIKDQYPGSVNWDPSGKGRAMKEWLQVPAEFEESWEFLSHQAKAFVEDN